LRLPDEVPSADPQTNEFFGTLEVA